MYDVFISAASEDFAYAKTVYDFLRGNNFHVFFSQESLQAKGSAEFREEIDAALDAAEHLLVVTSCAENVKKHWVKAEWGAFVNEKRSGRKRGNVVSVVFGDVPADALPLALRQFEIVPWDADGQRRLQGYLASSRQEIFRIDLRTKQIAWGRRPATHNQLSDAPRGQRIDGDKRGNVARVWESSFSDEGHRLCRLAADLILRHADAARAARVNLAGVIIEDNNGVVLGRGA